MASVDGEGPGHDARPRLEVVAAKGRDPGQAFAVHAGARLGRSEACEVRIDDSFASASHARIYPSGHAVFIEDLGSTNGTFVNGRQITRPLQLEVDDTVRIGDTELRYRE
jgi:predicted component of type VI protein secretion system